MDKIKLHKILIVEDDKPSMEALRSVMTTHCDIVLDAKDVDSAIEVINDNSDIQLIITDYIMPQRNGGDLIEFIRHSTFNNNGRHIPIIVVSAMPKQLIDIINSSPQYGIRALRKPLNAKDFYSLITKMVNNSEIQIIKASLKKLDNMLVEIKSLLKELL